MKVWELRTKQVTMICMCIRVRSRRRENLAGEKSGGQGRKSPSGSNERRKPTLTLWAEDWMEKQAWN